MATTMNKQEFLAFYEKNLHRFRLEKRAVIDKILLEHSGNELSADLYAAKMGMQLLRVVLNLGPGKSVEDTFYLQNLHYHQVIGVTAIYNILPALSSQLDTLHPNGGDLIFSAMHLGEQFGDATLEYRLSLAGELVFVRLVVAGVLTVQL